MEHNLRQFNRFIGTATFCKLLLNTSRRLIYPFSPELARGLNVDHTAITSVIAVNQATGLLGPFCAGFADRYGFRLFMLVSLAMLAVGTFSLGLIPLYSMLIICFFLTGLAKSIFDASLQAYIGNLVPLERRGRIIGITELSWAASTLVGIPATGLVIKHFSWQTPFFIISGLTLVCLLLLIRLLPKSDPASHIQNHASILSSSKRSNWKTILKNKQVKAILAFAFLASMANDNLFVIFGFWLEQSFGLKTAAIGFCAVSIGFAELLGEGFTVAFSDRIGLKRLTLFGIIACSLSYFILPLIDQTLPLVLAGIFFVFFTFELTAVTAMSLTTELVPHLRASTISAFFAVAGMGRVAGAFTGGLFWSDSGVWIISMISGSCMILSMVFFFKGFFTGKEI